MQRRDIGLLLKIFASLAGFAFSVSNCNGVESSESESFFNFIRAVDPKNALRIEWNQSLPHPCSRQWIGVRCHKYVPSISEIRLKNLNLSGILDAESVCKLPNLRILVLARNHIQGTVPDSIANCKSLIHLDVSRNFLSGSLPVALSKLKNLRRLDISNNHFSSTRQSLKQESQSLRKYQLDLDISGANLIQTITDTEGASSGPSSEGSQSGKTSLDDNSKSQSRRLIWILAAVGISFFLLLILLLYRKAVRATKDREILRALACTPTKTSSDKAADEVKAEDRRSELVFFVEEQERFGLEELLESAADLRNQGLCSSLYKVKLKNNAFFAVKRLKKLQVSFEEFGQTMRKIGNLRHQNLLPLVGYNSTNEEKLLIYRYQSNGSLLTLFQNYIMGKRTIPWRLRLSIAVGIARGLDFIYQWPDGGNIIPHGNLKSSNIMLNEQEEPLISEYGYSKFFNPDKACLLNSSAYTAPEKCLSEQADVFSFGVILLELLTGKLAENSGFDLTKWVKSKVREEWTGEVFDKEIRKFEMHGFPLLNISLKCVSLSPQERPSISEVLEKVEEVVNAEEDISPQSTISAESTQQDCCLLATRNTPGSNH